ncbi:MAG: SH3 domain-containing protein [Gammaproteobacteria bacterium]
MRIKYLLSFICCLFLVTGCREKNDVVSIFPLKNYNQTLSDWIKPEDPNYDTPLMPSVVQQQRLANFYKHTYGASSPWNPDYVKKILQASKPDDLKTNEEALIQLFNNKNKKAKEIGYGENFQPYTEDWINNIAANINLAQFDSLQYDAKNRAIAIDNLYARVLPTDDVFFFHYKIAGQGYPFDNLQISALWAGAPVYILTQTQDHAWSLVITSDYIGWVKSSGLARVSDSFIKTWVTQAFKQLAAITHTKTSILDSNDVFRFSAYVGSVFPVAESAKTLKIMIPVADAKQQAVIEYAVVSNSDAAILPIAPTRHNFSRIISTLLGRPYGWGNLYFYNDCSSELKSLMTPFGIWLPRHSSDQVYAGKFTDLSKESPKDRIEYLMERGQAFTTIVYIDGHILLFIGNFPDPNSAKHRLIPMTFQNMWGLKPDPSIRRAVIGKSVLFPMLEHYPEDSELISQAAKKHFQMSELGETANQLQKIEMIDLRDLMYP